MRGLKGTPGHQSDGVTQEAGDAMDVGGLEGFRQDHGRQHGGEPAPSTDLPAPGGPRSATLWSERLHNLSLHQRLSGCRQIAWLTALQVETMV
jgi:hypothetical protein